MNRQVSIKSFFAVILVCYGTALSFDLTLFPQQEELLSLRNIKYTNMLHTGAENDTFYMRGRFGVDFPLLGMNLDHIKSWDIGVTASAHINMIPENMKFAVDNFYAILTVYLTSQISEQFSFKLYPVYHLSAHLADGHKGGIDEEDVRAVSSEMVRAELYYRFWDFFEISPAYGWYYNVGTQKELKQRLDLSLLVKSEITAGIEPLVYLKGELVHLGYWRGGFDGSAGILFSRGTRGFGLLFRYFNRPHTSYYYQEYERGWGVEYWILN
ncbi:hypothetical protein QA601_12420 [Chitinispirillales bacterium ANBcel5]|uniref:hypothetical protein n=1 Tax=Cellulosispirillum alkaliphilum TaxID=3039283 RepID=UPI002A559761|nr:hypothetical protein [Chitinispirillales bacterium ANBcel5]